MSYLLIVESAGKIKNISEYLGDDYIVMASFGHIMDLNPNALSVDLETFEPLYMRNEDKISTIDKLYKQTMNVGKSNVFLASDEDREGEMIAWSLAKELNIINPKRIVFNSITKKELEKAVAHPKKIDLNMVYAQQARRILDRLVGFIISPILKKSLRGAESAGRVQSVVVKIVLDREKEIEKFFSTNSETFFTINTDITMGKYEFNSKLYNKIDNITLSDEDYDELREDTDDFETSKKTKSKTKNYNDTNNQNKGHVIFTKEQENHVIEIIKNMTRADYKLLKMTERIRKSNPPSPFTTSTLQQSASTRLNMDAKRTMIVAQKLYEAGYITYMRTDSTSISDEAMTNIKDEILSKYGEEYYERKEYVNKKGNTQEAHECIRPTKIYCDSIEGTTDEKRLYTMIWKRTIQSQMKAANYQNIIAEIEMLNRKILSTYKLIGTLENMIFVGYLIVDNKTASNPLNIDSIKKLNIEWENINGNEDTQKPPTRYNDASLIKKIDPQNLNIGRPSTYATIIDKIITRKYVEFKDIDGKDIDLNKYCVKKSAPTVLTVEPKTIKIGKEKHKLIPTELGRKATDFLEKYFSNLMDYYFTANMEKQLDDVADGKLDKLKVIKPLYEYIKTQIETIPISSFASNSTTFNKPEKIGKYDKYDVILNDGPYGKYVTCDNYKFNLAMLMNSKKSVIDELKAELAGNEDNNTEEITNEMIFEKTIARIETLKESIEKEWKIGRKKYVLKKGQYGHYIEEWNSSKHKTGNYTMKYLIDRIAKKNNINKETDDGIKQIIELITNKDIEDTVQYFSKNKTKSGTTYKKKSSKNDSE